MPFGGLCLTWNQAGLFRRQTEISPPYKIYISGSCRIFEFPISLLRPFARGKRSSKVRFLVARWTDHALAVHHSGGRGYHEFRRFTCSSAQIRMPVGSHSKFVRRIRALLCSFTIPTRLAKQAAEIRPKFDKAMRRLFRIYDIDRDGLLADAELNDFQHTSFSLNLSVEDIAALKRVGLYIPQA